MRKVEYISLAGAIASIVAVIYGAIGLFQEQLLSSLVSIILLELLLAFICFSFVFARFRVRYKYKWEEPYIYQCYIFKSATKLCYECVTMVQVTSMAMSRLPLRLTWTGTGDVKISSDTFAGKIKYKKEGNTIIFDVPFHRIARLGESVCVHFKLDLEDREGTNFPKLSKRIRKPCQYLVNRVVLEHKDSMSPARHDKYNWETNETVNIDHITFDGASKSFRAVDTNPDVGWAYGIYWNDELGNT